jgi:hypothetical protein
LMWTSMIVVLIIRFQNTLQVIFIEDQDLAQTLFASRSHPSFSFRTSCRACCVTQAESGAVVHPAI